MSEHKTVEELRNIAVEEQKKFEGKELTNKDRMAIPQMDMPSGEPKVRARQMTEVALGYTAEQAVVEAQRCLQCKNQP
ncbi:MAG: dihydropyrimidine dehydrogenase, partial [Treponema sp.]|nr:dihydropyrimidine dehydrogenase [Treponema sp.]